MVDHELLAASAPLIYELDVQEAFNACSRNEKFYSHHMSKSVLLLSVRDSFVFIPCSAAYSGARIILRQVSQESETIFDLLMELTKCCGGDWNQLRTEARVSVQDMNDLLDFGAAFLDSMGNYRVRKPVCSRESGAR